MEYPAVILAKITASMDNLIANRRAVAEANARNAFASVLHTHADGWSAARDAARTAAYKEFMRGVPGRGAHLAMGEARRILLAIEAEHFATV